jgi:hypothetical protein
MNRIGRIGQNCFGVPLTGTTNNHSCKKSYLPCKNLDYRANSPVEAMVLQLGVAEIYQETDLYACRL